MFLIYLLQNVRNADDESTHDFYIAPQDSKIIKETDNQKPQIWKDLQRDQVIINNELIVGRTKGADGIVAALTRHILTCAENCRKCSSLYGNSMMSVNTSNENISVTTPTSPITPGRSVQTAGSASRHTPGGTITEPPTTRPHSNSGSLLSRFTARTGGKSENDNFLYENDTNLNSSASNNFNLSEAHALACAKDILLLCNRTQSSGDAYFCVESFLAKCGLDTLGKDRYCHLMPLDSDSAPMEFMVHVGMCSPGAEVIVLPEVAYTSTTSTISSASSTTTSPQPAVPLGSSSGEAISSPNTINGDKDKVDIDKVRASIRNSMRANQRGKVSYVDSLNMGTIDYGYLSDENMDGKSMVSAIINKQRLDTTASSSSYTLSSSSSHHMGENTALGISTNMNNKVLSGWKSRFFPTRSKSIISSPRNNRFYTTDSDGNKILDSFQSPLFDNDCIPIERISGITDMSNTNIINEGNKLKKLNITALNMNPAVLDGHTTNNSNNNNNNNNNKNEEYSKLKGECKTC